MSPSKPTGLRSQQCFAQQPSPSTNGQIHPAAPERAECHRLARWIVTLAATPAAPETRRMPPACPVDRYARRYPGRPRNAPNATGLPGGSLRSPLHSRARSVKLHRASRWHLTIRYSLDVAKSVTIPRASLGISGLRRRGRDDLRRARLRAPSPALQCSVVFTPRPGPCRRPRGCRPPTRPCGCRAGAGRSGGPRPSCRRPPASRPAPGSAWRPGSAPSRAGRRRP